MSPRYLIANGTVVDGSGAPGRRQDVLVEGTRVTRVEANLSVPPDCEVLDAAGCVVTPGFIDAHSHSDFGILANPQMAPKLIQGITTDVVGNCGLGFFPVNDEVHAYYETIVKNLIGVGVGQYARFADLARAIEAGGTSMNLAFLIPQGNVRAFVMGMADGAPDPDQLEAMRAIVDESMAAGTFGLSTGLVYPPGSNSTTGELVALCEVVGAHGGVYATHVRNEGAEYPAALAEAIEIATRAGCRLQVSHVKITFTLTQRGARKKARAVLEQFEAARAKGLELTTDLYPYTSANSELAALILQPWVYEGGPAAFQRRLRDPETRARIIADFLALVHEQFKLPAVLRVLGKKTVAKLMLAILKRKVRVLAVKHHHELEGLTLHEVFQREYPDRDVFDAVLDFLADEEGAISISPEMMKRASLETFFAWPHAMVGSDSIVPLEGNCHPRTYGTFPRAIRDFSLDAPVVPLEELVRKMTSLPARVFGIPGRGLLRPGYHADVVAFDPESLRDRAVVGDACHYPAGIKFILVNGTLAARAGEPTGELAGEVLRHGPPSSPESPNTARS